MNFSAQKFDNSTNLMHETESKCFTEGWCLQIHSDENFLFVSTKFPFKKFSFYSRALFSVQILLNFLPLNTSEVKGEVVCAIAQWTCFFVFSKWIEIQTTTLLSPFYFNFNERKSPWAGFLIDLVSAWDSPHKGVVQTRDGNNESQMLCPTVPPCDDVNCTIDALDVRKSNAKNNKSQELSFNLKRFFFATRFRMEWNNKNNNAARLFAQQTQV